MAPCHVCDSPRLEPVHTAARPLGLVSSDVQALEARVTWAVCPRCATIQKVLDRDWRRLADDIYARYQLNHQAAGEEPRLFNTPFGSGPRTEILLKYLLRLIDLPPTGKLLDIGCSNGNLLKSFHRIRPAWDLYGYEISDAWKDEVLALPGVRGFHAGTDVTYPFRYDLITVCHVLEHVPNPAAFLRPLLGNLAPSGRLVVIVPNIRQNTIDLLIADHCSHFDADSLDRLLRFRAAGDGPHPARDPEGIDRNRRAGGRRTQASVVGRAGGPGGDAVPRLLQSVRRRARSGARRARRGVLLRHHGLVDRRGVAGARSRRRRFLRRRGREPPRQRPDGAVDPDSRRGAAWRDRVHPDVA